MRQIGAALLAFAVFAGGLPAVAHAADPEPERPWRTIALRDGSTHSGRYQELIDGRVRLTGGGDDARVFAPEEIQAVYELVRPTEIGAPAQRGDLELSLLGGLSVSAGATQFEDTQWRLTMLGGYQLASFFQVGIESAIATDFRSRGSSLFDLAVTGTFHFGTAPIGYVRALAGVEVASFGGGTGAGPLLGVAAGVKVPLSRRGALLAGVRYAWSQVSLTAERVFLGEPETDLTLTTHSIGLELGWLVYF